MKITLPNGLTLEGTEQQIQDTCKSLGYQNIYNPTAWYKSESRGYIKIKEMSTVHVRNAIQKMYREWLDTIQSLSGIDYLIALKNGNIDPTFLALVAEYVKRYN